MDLKKFYYQTSFVYLLLAFLLAGCTKSVVIEEGVSLELARVRKQQIQEINYDLKLNIPAHKTEPISGTMTISFEYSGQENVVVDFKADPSDIHSVSVQGQATDYKFQMGHVIIEAHEFTNDRNNIVIDFTAGDMSLNRNEDFLYTLFVPDRASTAFPLFDQPDLKAVYGLTLEIPFDWVAMANGELLAVDSTDQFATWYFAETAPLSTYLFSFVAGEFESISREKGDRIITMLHRETDTAKVSRNIDQLFDLHFNAIDWLEDYTGIAYPFQKFGFVLIPSFQYGGMEHPGAILYNDRIFLEESYTQSQLLGRASVIAHETAHMWFGDLVTMEWFNDVWLKEVFANFMAAKIINPNFPDINHSLRFLMAHYPSAYSIDRTQGANPIQQQLENLKNAGQMYGAIIYQKAPIVMRHLEAFVGEDIFRESLQEYLRSYSYTNATWDDLVGIIDKNSEKDVTSWSESWVKEPGMPTLDISMNGDDSIIVEQSDNLSLRPQPINLLIRNETEDRIMSVFMSSKKETLSFDEGGALQQVIPNPDGFSYGRFSLPQETLNLLLNNPNDFEDPVVRGSSWIMLNEAMLNFEIEPKALLQSAMSSLSEENELQNAQYILNIIGNIFWRYLTSESRELIASQVEELLLNELQSRESSREKAMIFNSFINLATTEESLQLLNSWWNESSEIEGLPFSENHFTQLAYELALKQGSRADSILKAQIERINNPDRKKRMEFVVPALSENIGTRNIFFESLKSESNREHEPWVLSGLRYLHHPLRSEEAIQYILPSLELLEEIQQTGDIFFPTRWLGSTFSGHNSKEAADIVNKFLEEHPDYPPKLREKILQTADQLFRAAQWNQSRIESNL